MTSVRHDPFVRAARFVGDLGNPFYEEERQRDVWNEACAFGLQLLLWGTARRGRVGTGRGGAQGHRLADGGAVRAGDRRPR